MGDADRPQGCTVFIRVEANIEETKDPTHCAGPLVLSPARVRNHNGMSQFPKTV